MKRTTLVAMPMKPFELGKSRLASVLSIDERRNLTRSLFRQSNDFFRKNFPEFDRLVVTCSPEVQRSCAAVGADCLLEPGVEGLNVAACRAVEWATERGYARIVLVACDVLVWLHGEVCTLLSGSRTNDVVVARAHDGGTNVLVLRLPTPMECRYGANSAREHCMAANHLGLSALVCNLPFLARDLDTPADFAASYVRSHALVHRS